MQQELTTSFTDVLRFLRRGLLLAFLVSIVAGALAFIISTRLPATYKAETILVASKNNDSNVDSGGFLARPLDVKVYRTVAKSEPVIISAMKVLGIENPSQKEVEQFSKPIGITTEGSSDWNEVSSIISLSYSSRSPEEAAKIANELSLALISWDKNRAREALEQSVSSIGQQVESLEEQLRALQATGAAREQTNGVIAELGDLQQRVIRYQALIDTAQSYLTTIRPAIAPLTQESPRPVFNTALAIVLALIFSYGILLLRAALDTRLRDVEDLAMVSDLPVLASFPRLPNESRRLPHEAISYLRTNLLFSMADAHPKVILVTSANASEGKSSVSLSLAESFVRNNYRTLLVDADLRKPVVAKEYRISKSKKFTSLEDWLRNPYGPNQPHTLPIGGRYNLYVVPTFESTSQAPELLSSGFRESLDSWRKEYDVIIIDSAPVLAVADTLTIAPLCTGTLLVVNQQKTDRRQVHAVVDLFKRIGVRMSGVVATHVTREAGHSTGYGYGYGYGMAEDEEPKKTMIPETVTATNLSKQNR
jgi:non-specific protein-tyrosine kinase